MNFKAGGYECANNEHMLYGKSSRNVRIDSSQSNAMQPKSSMKMTLPRSIRSRPTAPRHRTLPTPLVRQIGNRQPSLDFQLPLQYTRLPRTFVNAQPLLFFVFCFPSLSARHVVPRTTRPIPALSPTQTRPLLAPSSTIPACGPATTSIAGPHCSSPHAVAVTPASTTNVHVGSSTRLDLATPSVSARVRADATSGYPPLSPPRSRRLDDNDEGGGRRRVEVDVWPARY